MLAIRDLHTYYGDSHILQGVTLDVPEGKLVALLGRNGVGKTTLIRSIMGFTPARRGQILFLGKDLTRLPSHQVARMGVGLVPQGRRVFPSLSVRENLVFATRSDGASSWTLDRVLQLFPALEARLRNRGNELSGGEQQMLAIARALMTNPRLLLMDEPSEGLAPLLVQQLTRVLQGLKAQGLSILLVEQNLPLALKVADRVYIMTKGRVVYQGTPEALSADAEVKSRYLGV